VKFYLLAYLFTDAGRGTRRTVGSRTCSATSGMTSFPVCSFGHSDVDYIMMGLIQLPSIS